MKQQRTRSGLHDSALPFLVLLLFFALWESAVRVLRISRDVFPPPSRCLTALADPQLYNVSDSRFNDEPAIMGLMHFASSLGRVAVALVIVGLVAIPFAVWLEWSVRSRQAFTPLFSLLASVTPIVWTLIAIRMEFLDREFGMPAFVIMAASIFLMSLSIRQQFASVPNSQRVLGQRLGATGWKFWRRVIFPSSAPHLLHLFRVQFLFGLTIVPFVELSGVQYGVGQLVYRAKVGSNISLALGLIILLAATGYGVDFLFRALQNKCFKWQMSTGGIPPHNE